MTQLEKLIRDTVSQSVATKISHTTDLIAEDMAREILQDPVFRTHVQLLIKHAFEATLKRLDTESE